MSKRSENICCRAPPSPAPSRPPAGRRRRSSCSPPHPLLGGKMSPPGISPPTESSSAAEAARSEEWRPITRPGASVQMVHTRREVARLDTALVGRSAISLVLSSFSMKYKYPNWIQIPLSDTQVYYSCLCSLCYFHGRAALVVVNTVSGPKLCKQHPRLQDGCDG